MSKLYENGFFFTFIDFSGSHSCWPLSLYVNCIYLFKLIICSGFLCCWPLYVNSILFLVLISCWHPSWDFARPVVTPRLSRGSSSHYISAEGQSHKHISHPPKKKAMYPWIISMFTNPCTALYCLISNWCCMYHQTLSQCIYLMKNFPITTKLLLQHSPKPSNHLACTVLWNILSL